MREGDQVLMIRIRRSSWVPLHGLTAAAGPILAAVFAAERRLKPRRQRDLRRLPGGQEMKPMVGRTRFRHRQRRISVLKPDPLRLGAPLDPPHHHSHHHHRGYQRDQQ